MDGQTFLDHVLRLRKDGWRLSLINATAVLPSEVIEEGAFDISWSFARDTSYEHIRHRVLPGEDVPSIGGFFPGAYLYENELRELFGINVTGMIVDLQGQLYQTAERVPFAPSAIRRRLEAAGRLEGDKHHAKPAAAAATVPSSASPSGEGRATAAPATPAAPTTPGAPATPAAPAAPDGTAR